MSQKKGKVENANNKGKNIQKTDADEGLVINEAFRLSIRLKPEDDVPHPRHLCFAYPFGKSSPKKHYTKCYCYVCEKVAPCKYWKKQPKRHCDATEKDSKWVRERKLNKKLPDNTTMLHHQLNVSSSYHASDDGLELCLNGIGGGLICNNDGRWVMGISLRFFNNFVENHDISVPYYITLLEGLQLTWSEGFRNLDIKLGYMYHNRFWSDFTRDAVTRKFRLCVNPFNRPFKMLKEVEDYLNRDWFIEVKNTESYGEEAGAITIASFADCQEQAKQVYDFRTHPIFRDTTITETMVREFDNRSRMVANILFDSLGYEAPADFRNYCGLD